MAKSLNTKELRQLIEWMGQDSKVKRLKQIYSAQQQGCTPAVFHQFCDNQGPCVAVAFNTVGFVWGGYAPQGFNQTETCQANASCFLFRLRGKNSTAAEKKYPYVNVAGVWNRAALGPAFGHTNLVTHDMILMQGATTKSAAGVFDNTQGAIGNSGAFNFQGDASATICGNNYQLQDLVVYQLTDLKILPGDAPWRSFNQPWNEETLGRLKREVAGYSPLECLAVPQMRVLMLGQVGSGKSSFFNTINSAFYGYVTGQAPTGSATHSLTTRYRTYEVRRGRGGGALHFRLCDTMGLEKGYGMDVTEIPYLLDGHVADRYVFNPTARISPDMHGFKRSPELQDKIHTVAFVVDSSTVSVMPQDILDKMHAVRTHVNQRAIPLVVLLTKIDQICPDVQEDLACVFQSMQVKDKVDEVAEKIGLPRSHVLPLKNYESEVDLDVRVDILALLAMRQIIRLADNYFDEQLDILLSQELDKKVNFK